jgi:antitoxin component YwqK of YwqJK toxin-antitoxin module
MLNTSPKIEIKKTRNSSGRLKSVEYTKDGLPHKEDGPAFISYYVNGNVQCAAWYKEGIRHRIDGPAFLDYHDDGSLREESWCRGDEFHREDGPSRVVYLKNGSKTYEAYHKNGKRHREDGPAEIWYQPDTTVHSIRFWLEMRQIGFWEFFERVTPENRRVLLRDWIHHA